MAEQDSTATGSSMTADVLLLGDGRFVHAPSSGKVVRSDRLDSPYWKKHLSEARRLAV